MINKNTDGIKKIKQSRSYKKNASLAKTSKPRVVRLDGITKIQISSAQHNQYRKVFGVKHSSYVVPVYPASKNFFALRSVAKKLYASRKVPVLAIVVALLIAFSGGMWAALSTTKTAAVDDVQTNQQVSNTMVPLEGGQLPAGTTVSNDVLFNTPIEYLKNYLATTAQPDIIKQRTDQVSQFLKDRNSPLAGNAETIAEQPHWKLILAIAFAESTLGKHCFEFNCSGIGGAQIKTYSSTKQWIVDFNRLLEKRYKDDTLEQMCGVYVQPCTSNWLLATKQILSSLEEKGIE